LIPFIMVQQIPWFASTRTPTDGTCIIPAAVRMYPVSTASNLSMVHRLVLLLPITGEHPCDIDHLTSKDLYNWTDKGKVYVGTVGEGPNVICWHDRYYMIVDEWKGLSVFSSDDALNWKKQEEYLISGIPVDPDEAPQTTGDLRRTVRMVDGTRGNHADIEISNNHAYMFYFCHLPTLNNMRGSAVYVQELIYNEDGTISCDPLLPCYINLH
jgi:hypothetical protein